MQQATKRRRIPYLIEGLALLFLLLIIAFALKGNIAGRAVYTNKPCREGTSLLSCATDSTDSYLIELSCKQGKWRELSTRCDCAIGEKGAYCAG